MTSLKTCIWYLSWYLFRTHYIMKNMLEVQRGWEGAWTRARFSSSLSPLKNIHKTKSSISLGLDVKYLEATTWNVTSLWHARLHWDLECSSPHRSFIHDVMFRASNFFIRNNRNYDLLFYLRMLEKKWNKHLFRNVGSIDFLQAWPTSLSQIVLVSDILCQVSFKKSFPLPLNSFE